MTSCILKSTGRQQWLAEKEGVANDMTKLEKCPAEKRILKSVFL